ncbi:MAG TPA: BBP7 family outer membrane beta-barrel protein [Pirellulales bacterium]|nr:BBP7 family outer membrane beta-barrel protein [Pirellulales bacterium]
MCCVRPSRLGRPPRIVFPARTGLLATLLFASTVSAATFDLEEADPGAWFRLEYVNLWVSHASLPAPLVTTGDASSLGRLGFAQTRTLLGPGQLAAPVFPALRLTLGGWMEDEVFGGEVSVFATALRATHFSAASDVQGSPLLAIPFEDVTSGTPHESSLVLSQPGAASGGVWTDDAASLFGLELDGLGNLTEYLPGNRATLTLLGGFRLLAFRERFRLSSDTSRPAMLPVSFNDTFLADDTFIGPEIGLRGGYRYRRWTIQGTAKAAIGGTLSTVYESPQASISFVAPRIQAFPDRGWFVQPSNTGREYHRALSVVPAAQIRVGYDLTARLRLTIGYEAFYWTRMLRAPNQIDRQLNLSQAVGPLVGPSRPAELHKFSNFWAQGFTVGLQFNY